MRTPLVSPSVSLNLVVATWLPLIDPNFPLLDSGTAYSQVIGHVTQAPDLPPNDGVYYSEVCEHEDRTVSQNSIQ